MKELWKDIPSYEGLYQISNLGRVKSLSKFHKISKDYSSIGYWSKERILKNIEDKQKYFMVKLSKNGKLKNYRVHRLVAQLFVENPNNLSQVNHKDGNKHNNCFNNLEWCTCKDNIRHAWINGLNYNTEHQYLLGKSKSKRVFQYTTNGDFVKDWESMTIVTKKLGISTQSISKCCKGLIKTAGGFVWKYKNEKDSIK